VFASESLLGAFVEALDAGNGETFQLVCECLGESLNTFDSRMSRNPRLKEPEFSVILQIARYPQLGNA
jgi:hypothetical protein